MSFLSRIFGLGGDPREELRPLWHRTVELAREHAWFADLGVEDSVAGRFDMIATILSLVLLRMEGEPDLARPSVMLTELFVEDMDGQLRESGVGDQVVGKHIGRLMAALGGRLGALREALASADDALLADYAGRNTTLLAEASRDRLAAGLRQFADRLAQTDTEALLKGEIA